MTSPLTVQHQHGACHHHMTTHNVTGAEPVLISDMLLVLIVIALTAADQRRAQMK